MPRSPFNRSVLDVKTLPMRELLAAVQSHVARISVSASAVRGQRTPGIVEAGRDFLRQFPLNGFGTASATEFAQRLDRTTEDLAKSLPGCARRWGLARKLLNIFLRDCLYNAYLRDAHHLASAEGFLEVPLDSITAAKIRKVGGRTRLSQWRGVRHLSPEVSAEYQAVAAEFAALHQVARVHLDAFWWSVSRD